jgi:hypothetical protein
MHINILSAAPRPPCPSTNPHSAAAAMDKTAFEMAGRLVIWALFRHSCFVIGHSPVIRAWTLVIPLATLRAWMLIFEHLDLLT